MNAKIHMVSRNEVFTVNDVMPRILSHYRALHQAINCNPDRLISVKRAPGHALAVMEFARGGKYIIRFV